MTPKEFDRLILHLEKQEEALHNRIENLKILRDKRKEQT